MKNHLEILAPAGDEKGVIAAINGGADAVYFGGKAFNARQKAANFDIEAMARMIKLCHQNEVKVYITFNTLIKDEELEEAINYAAELVNLKPDGIIVQDPGLIDLLSYYADEIPLQTSTQASVYGLDGVLFFQELGFKRVVLPREMTLEEAEYISENSDVELKVFGHGALCYAYSGQCLFSSLIGGRSGNRGLCAQPCRKQYTLYDAGGNRIKKGFLLSMRDLNTLEHIERLQSAGIAALKIEGRMKSPEYIYTVSKAYKSEKLDVQSDIDDETLSQVFNRSFTGGWLLNDPNRLNDRIGKNRGVAIGKILRYRSNQLEIELMRNVELESGDGIAFGDHAESGIEINRIKQKGRIIAIPWNNKSIPEGIVYRTYSKKMMAELSEKANAPVNLIKEKIDVHLSIKTALPIKINVIREDGTYIVFDSSVVSQKAEKISITVDQVQQQIAKLGDTDYVLNRFSAEIADGVFIPKSHMNAIRREIVERLDIQNKKVPIQLSLQSSQYRKSKVSHRVISVELTKKEQLADVLDSNADEIVIPWEAFDSIKDIDAAIQAIKRKNKKVLLAFPQIINSYCAERIKTDLSKLLRLNTDGVLIRNYEMLHILKKIDIYKEADKSMHLFNYLSGDALYKWGCTAGVVSPEITGKAANALAKQTRLDCTLEVYGHQEMMVSANCVINCGNKRCDHCKHDAIYYLQDERGCRFPLIYDNLGYTHIYNADKLFLKKEILHCEAVSKWRITLLDEQAEEIRTIIDYYKNNCDDTLLAGKQLYTGRYTKGNFKRGVQ